MLHLEIPSDDEVVAALMQLGGRASAVQLRDLLIEQEHSVSRSELAIQRAADRGRIFICRDWTLSVEREQQVA